MVDNIIYSDQKKVESIIANIIKDGSQKLHILADFDKTLTPAFVQGEPFVSIIALLREQHYLTPDYSAKAQALYEKYHLIEKDATIPLTVKKQKISEWYYKHFELLIKSGLNKKDIVSIINSPRIVLRPGFLNLVEKIKQHNIPLVIISASGLGKEAIELILKKFEITYRKIFIISNEFIWDNKGYACQIKEPIVHSVNKDEVLLKNFPFNQEIESRKNVILLGDSPDDIEMVTGFHYDNLLKIGFLNKDIEQREAIFKERYDLLITHDGSLEPINNIIDKF